MRRYSSDPGFVGVFLDGPSAVRVVMKGTKTEVLRISGSTVTMVGAKYSFADLQHYADQLMHANPLVHETSIESDRQAIVAMLPLAATGVVVDAAKSGLPPDIAITVNHQEPETLAAAEGGSTATGNGCTTGFRFNGNLISTAAHCPDSWGTVNGVAITHQQDICELDLGVGTGSPLGLDIQGMPFSGVQNDPPYGSLVYKYGNQTGWTYGYTGYYGTTGISCGVGILQYSGGTMASIPGDSGGPYVTLEWNGAGYSYSARGHHRGNLGATMHSIPINNVHFVNAYVA
jgi:hypothetical protein